VKTVRELIALSADYLGGKGVESARLNAERLLADVLGVTRIDLYLQADRPVVGDELDRYRELLRRRGAGEPLQTIIGSTGFYSRDFKVEPGVFIPRPETERLVEAAVGLLTPPDRRLVAPKVVEIGSGSGIIAVSIAAEVPSAEVWAVDRNPLAVRLTERNAAHNGVAARVHTLEGDLLGPVPARLRGDVDLLVSNPPYVRRGDMAGLSREVQHDPPEALDGGEDGLDVYRALAAAAPRWLAPGGWLALEIGDDQGESVPALLRASGLVDVAMSRDWNDLPRVVVGRRADAATPDQ
jgi:release factor glutamine methyltransferase